MRGSVSRAALRRIVEELLRVDYVGTNRKICGCTLRTSYGLPCACELGRHALGGIPIPIDVIHVHWRKLTMEVELEVGADDGSEVDMTCAIDELWKRFRSLDVIGKKALKSRVNMKEGFPLSPVTLDWKKFCSYTATSWMLGFAGRLQHWKLLTPLCPPPEKLKTKGWVKKKGKKPTKYDVYRDPSYHEYVDKASQSSQRQPQPSQTSKKLKLSKKQPQFTLQFPNHIRSYIEDVVNVESDGNCGFRVIASLHGYGEDGWSMIYVNMKEGFPLSPVTLDWKKFRSYTATSWMLGFAGRLQYWKLLTPLCPPPEKLKTKGWVKKKGKKPTKYDVYRDPSYHEYVDKASQSSQRQPQPSQTSKKLKLSKKQPQFTLQFPNHIRSYIEDVVNVESDGNCGFRVIASLHGYGEDGWSMIYVNMKEGFPLSPVTLDWKKFRSYTATSWMLGFAGRLQHWKLLTPLCPPPEKLKTKGWVKKKGKKPTKYDVYRDPSYHEYVDKASQSSQRQPQPSQTSKKLKLSKKQPQFTLQFPNHIRSYIEDVVNVESDGNCGFRVIASLHGYG
ncbi:hypothetical protein KIW84_057678 [Lathyrus oleraceus]|uniref:OTU domain-containing protein n=1 Tax=Pisum sativum TaxID=3888 RepID=A0A9D5AP69_PEA|nr:hypothetical protein KIW84_057678 [Pisum sativum]